MSDLEKEYQAVFSFLRSLNFHFLDTWVRECVDYYKTTEPNIPIDVLKNEVKKQWLLVNLRDIKVPSLPPNLVNKEKTILEGKYAVQVESMIDCSESYYSQFKRIKNANNVIEDTTNEDAEKWNCKSKRCLTFDLCDGVQEIRGMEYTPISKIRTCDPELLPGFKMIIIGPVECRKGMILLKEENIKICGGEVDIITTTNNLRSILLRKLDLNESDVLETDCSSDRTETLESVNATAEIDKPLRLSNSEEDIENLLSQNNDLFLSLPLESDLFEQEAKVSQEKKLDTLDYINCSSDKSEITDNTIHESFENYQDSLSSNTVFDDIFLAVNKKHSLSNENLCLPDQKRRSFDLRISNSSPTLENNTSSDNNADSTKESMLQTMKHTQHIKTKSSVQTNLDSFFSNHSSYKSTESNCMDKSIENINPKQPTLISTKPFVYLKHIMSENIHSPTVFTIKAVILTLKKKITIFNDEYNLKANITDGSLSVDVDFSSSVLESILGYSPCEMSAMIKAKQTNKAMADRVKDAFLKAQEKLISLNCLMDIKVSTDGKPPVILSLKEVTLQHLNELKARRLSEN